MDPTLPDHARLTPDKPAYIMASSGVVVTYAELEAASKTDAQLRRLCTIPGIGPVTAGAVSACDQQNFLA